MEVKIILVDYYEPNKEFIDIVKPTKNNKQMIFRLGIIDPSVQNQIFSCTNKQKEFAKLEQFAGKTFDNIVKAYNDRNGSN